MILTTTPAGDRELEAMEERPEGPRSHADLILLAIGAIPIYLRSSEPQGITEMAEAIMAGRNRGRLRELTVFDIRMGLCQLWIQGLVGVEG